MDLPGLIGSNKTLKKAARQGPLFQSVFLTAFKILLFIR